MCAAPVGGKGRREGEEGREGRAQSKGWSWRPRTADWATSHHRPEVDSQHYPLTLPTQNAGSATPRAPASAAARAARAPRAPPATSRATTRRAARRGTSRSRRPRRTSSRLPRPPRAAAAVGAAAATAAAWRRVAEGAKGFAAAGTTRPGSVLNATTPLTLFAAKRKRCGSIPL